MGQAGNYDELEFELALTGVLEDIYDLKVRTDRDLLNRRRNVGPHALAALARRAADLDIFKDHIERGYQ